MEISKERLKQIIQEEMNDELRSQQDERKDEWKSVQHNLDRIKSLSEEVQGNISFGEDVPEWVQEHVAVMAAMLQSIRNYQGQKVR